MSYPDWWKDGAEVIGKDGTQGRLVLQPDGAWQCHLKNSDGYILHPDPDHWFSTFTPEISEIQMRQIVYEVDRALLVAMGRGGLLDWNSVPERRKVEDPSVAPAPLGSALDALRIRLRSTGRGVLEKP